MSDEYGLDKYTNEDKQKAIARLSQSSPIAPGYGWLSGQRFDGRTVWFPGSYLAGYRSFLAGGTLTIRSEFLGFIGQLSDGTIAYLPSFSDGIRDARNDLRTAILAEAQRRTFAEISEINRRVEEEKRKSEEEKRALQEKVNALADKVAKLEKKNDDKKQG